MNQDERKTAARRMMLLIAAAGVRAILPIDPATVPLPWLFAEVVFMLAAYAGLLALAGALRRLLHRRDDTALDIL